MASLASRERGGSQMVGRITVSRAACSSLPDGLVVVSLTQRGRAAISAGVQDAGLGAEGVASEVRLLRVVPLREAPVPQPQPLRPGLVCVLCASKGGQPQVLQGQGTQRRYALLAACALEGVKDLLGGGGRVDIEGDPACPQQVGVVPDLRRGPGDPHGGDEGGHAAEDKDGGLRGSPAIGLGKRLGQDPKPVERAIGWDGYAPNPVGSW